MPHWLVSAHMWHDLFVPGVPLAEKILRPALVYLFLVVALRVFGKRELAQLNPFDLVVLLSLSNAVQNAIIGDDNSVTGGVIGACSLLAINWLVVQAAFRSHKLDFLLEGRATVLIRNGQVDRKALKRESMTREELLAAVHRQGFEGFHHVRKCELEPNGAFYIEPFEPTLDDKRHAELLARLDAMSKEIACIRGVQPSAEGGNG